MKKIRLSEIDTLSPKKFDKEKTKEKLVKVHRGIAELQNLLFAESKHSLLIILQGMDASGKDGAIKKVFEPINPMGCRVFSFKVPTELEMRHDFLWRVHQNVPEKGMIHIFNRSHYEDVLTERVHHLVDERTIERRYDHINNFERLLKQETDTVVLKFYLHISKEEQLKRLKERLSDPSKMWKYNKEDIKERKHWDAFMRAYEIAFERCSEYAEWNVVPADHNWYKEYIIAKKVLETLEGFKMKYPGLKKSK